MEIIFEIIAQLFFEAGFEASESSRVLLWVRVLLLAILAIFFIGIGGGILLLAVAIGDQNIWGRVFVGAIGAGMIIFVLVRISRFIKSNRRK